MENVAVKTGMRTPIFIDTISFQSLCSSKRKESFQVLWDGRFLNSREKKHQRRPQLHIPRLRHLILTRHENASHHHPRHSRLLLHPRGPSGSRRDK